MRPPLSQNVRGRHAIVCGSSMAGLFAAGLLARHFERVTLVERDHLEGAGQPRKGVPQGTQTHIILRRGLDIAAHLFPGLREDLRTAGAQVFDMSADCELHTAGVWRKRIDSGVFMYSMTRPLLEWRVRGRLAALPSVNFLAGYEGTGFLLGEKGTRITGLRVRALGDTAERELEADLVVDASGRGSRTPHWLEALGIPRVEETRLQIDVGYATRLYRKPRGPDTGWKALVVSPELPRLRRTGVILPVENDRWTVTLCGWLKDDPPTDDQGFLEYTRTLARPHVYEVLRNAEPLGPAIPHHYSHSQWRHYERLPHLPEGLVVVGDAFCSLNPFYGQGITSSALQVELLGQCLREGVGGLSRRYFERAGLLLKRPWSMAASEDLRLPEVEAPRPLGFGLFSWYINRLKRLTAKDDEAIRTYLRVMHMLQPPLDLFSPRLVLKVLAGQPSASELPPGPAPCVDRNC